MYRVGSSDKSDKVLIKYFKAFETHFGRLWISNLKRVNTFYQSQQSVHVHFKILFIREICLISYLAAISYCYYYSCFNGGYHVNNWR